MFYCVNQNNSGGYYIKNDDVAEFLIIEAANEDDFEDRLDNITENYSKYCPCCGERWETFMVKGTEEPTIHGKLAQGFLDNDKYYKNYTAIIYYLDGRKEKIMSKNKEG